MSQPHGEAEYNAATEQIPPAQTAPIFMLPSELILEIMVHLSFHVELFDFASCCKQFSVHLRENYLWQLLCKDFGIDDLSRFPKGLTYRKLYTELLHVYVPTLGIWASDAPYRGNLIEFFYFFGDEENDPGVYGDVWDFDPPDILQDEQGRIVRGPHQPIKIRNMRIVFAHNHPEEPSVVIDCMHQPYDEAESGPHTIALQVIAPHTQSIMLRAHRRSFQHPSFPGPVSPWHDNEHRRVPRLPAIVSRPVIDSSPTVFIYPAAKLPVLYTAPASDRSLTPPGLIVRSNEPICRSWHTPRVPIENILPFPPTYFPLRHVYHNFDHEWAEDEIIDLSDLQGLWICSNIQDESQVLWFDRCDSPVEPGNPDASQPVEGLAAWRVTGDMFVPRGSWYVSVRPTQHPRRFIGVGVIGEMNFTVHRNTSVKLEIVHRDLIRLIWVDQHSIQICLRCKTGTPG